MGPCVSRALASIATALAVVATLAAAPPATALDDPQQVALALDRPAFSPNGDGVADTATAIVTTDVAGAVLTLEVLDTAGALVNTLLAAVPVPPGETTATWKGLDDANRSAPDGAYTIRATVVDASAVSITAEAALVLDTVAPSVHWRSIAPQPVRSRAATVRISFRLAGAEQGKLVVTDAAGTIVHRDAWDGSGGLVTRTWNLRDERRDRVPPGLYSVRVIARDAAGNVGASAPRALRDEHPVAAQVVTSVRGAGRRVALTFDDCNSGSAWAKILQALDATEALATFFCPGPRVLANPALARRTVRDGHAVGSHGWDHADMRYLSAEQIRSRLRRDEAAWWRTTGAMAVPLLRPPYGSLDDGARAAAGSAGYAWIALWSVDPRDWELPGTGVIASRVLGPIHAGSIVVMHVNPQTAAALPAILRGLRARDLQPVTLLDLLANASSVEPGRVQRMPV